MSADLKARLRVHAAECYVGSRGHEWATEAADRIDQLEAALREARRLVPETGGAGNPIPLWALQIGEQIEAALNGSKADV